ncbi:MAG: FecR domain-containing protein [Nibricoccus sp.]
MKSHENNDPDDRSNIDHQAADWLVRRDRGLSSSEQDEYLQWLGENPEHAAAYERHEATLHRLEQLRHWQPAVSAEPNPDLFAPPKRFKRHLWLATFSAAAALAFLATFWLKPHFRPEVQKTASIKLLVENERQVLPDGSAVDLREGSKISVAYTEAERRVKLLGGQVLFEVAKNPARPFVVEVNGFTVRAVGTAFSVQLKNAAAVEVLVTEGKVSLGHSRTERSPTPVANAPFETEKTPAAATPLVVAGERAVVSLSTTELAPVLTQMSQAEIKEELAWQTPLLQFYETPLGEAVAAFNRHNQRQLVIADEGIASTPIGGSFRVNNIEGFARLLEYTLGLRADKSDPHRIVLKRGSK